MMLEGLMQHGEYVLAVEVSLRQHDSLMAGFYLQDNGQFLPLSGTCKSNWRHHYAAVIGSFVNGGSLSKQFFFYPGIIFS